MRQQDSRESSGERGCGPAQLSSLPRGNGAKMQLPLGWGAAAGQHEDRNEVRQGQDLGHYCWAQLHVWTESKCCGLFILGRMLCSCVNLSKSLVQDLAPLEVEGAVRWKISWGYCTGNQQGWDLHLQECLVLVLA